MKKPALAFAALLAATGARAAAISPGEQMVLSVRYLGVPTGEGRIEVGEPSGDVWPVFFEARTAGAVGFLDIREHLVSYWDDATGLPRGSDLRAVELGDYHADSVRFDRMDNRVTVTVERSSGTNVKSASVPVNAQDLAGAFMALRLRPLAVGQRIELPVCTGTSCFPLTADVLDRERIDTPAGSFDTLRVQVRTGLTGKFSTKRGTYLWLSDDPRHLLVRMSADFAVGSVVATLKSYKPGNEVASLR